MDINLRLRHLREVATEDHTFSPSKIKKVEKKIDVLQKKHGNRIPFHALGLHHSETELHPSFKKNLLTSKTPKSKKTFSDKNVPIASIHTQDQDGVSAEHLKKLLPNINKMSRPDLVEAHEGKHWVNEGHHRLALHALAGHKHIPVRVEHNPKL